MYEEFGITKTNKHGNRQRRVLIIEGSAIYHKKQCIDQKSGQPREPVNYLSMQNEKLDANASTDVLFVAGAEFENVSMNGGASTNLTASFRGDDSARKSKAGVMSKFQSFVSSKVFSSK